jgi:hypothetical protein
MRLWDQTGLAGAQLVTARGDLTSGLWVNCKNGCAGGSTTPTDAFANPTTAGLSMVIPWYVERRHLGSDARRHHQRPLDQLQNWLLMTFPMLWNGTSWDRLYGDKTNGAFVNIKNSVALQLATGGNVIGSISNTTFAVTESGTWVMRMQDGSGNALTSNSTTYTAKFALDGNLLGTLGTAFSTPGKIDVIGTVATTPPANASTNIAQYGGTNVGAANAFHVQPGTSATWDTSDRAARLLGVVYGSQGQQLQQSATNFNAYAELRTGATAYDARQIRALTSADVATANQGTANSAANGWPVKLTDGTNTAGVAADNGQAAATNRVPILPAIALATPPAAATTGRDAALLTDLHRIQYTSQMPTDVASYVASKQGLASAASATDIAVLSGNASNTVIVTKIMVSCTQTTAGIIDLILLKRSTADTAGTSTGSPTTVPLDSSNAAGSSSVLTYTANPTTGSLVGNVDVRSSSAAWQRVRPHRMTSTSGVLRWVKASCSEERRSRSQ